MPYWQLYYHIVWATKNRQPIIEGTLEKDLFQYLRGKGKSMGATIHALGGVEDHVHLAASIPPDLTLSKFIGQIKGASSHWVNQIRGHSQYFSWQRGYGVLSFSKKALPRLVPYVLNQEEHHLRNSVIRNLERIDPE